MRSSLGYLTASAVLVLAAVLGAAPLRALAGSPARAIATDGSQTHRDASKPRLGAPSLEGERRFLDALFAAALRPIG